MACGTGLLIGGCAGLTATTEPKGNQPTSFSPPAVSGSAGTGQAVLRLRAAAGQRVRTHRHLAVTEFLAGGQKLKSAVDESYLQTVLRVDGDGAPVSATRLYERYETTVERPGGEAQTESSALEGSEIELVQRDSGVTARLISGKAAAS